MKQKSDNSQGCSSCTTADTFTDAGRHAGAFLADLSARRLPNIGAWCLRTIEALPDSEASAAGYRDLLFGEDGVGRWYHPRSNAAERINAFLYLYRRLGDPRYLAAARHYADAMLDPTRGIYDGPDPDARGHVWYWRDAGLYMTNYTMRVPAGMFALFDETGDERYRTAALLSGEALLREQAENGILCEGRIPNPPVHAEAPVDLEANPHCCTTYKVNSRIGYCVLAFGILHRRTGDSRYQRALTRLVDGMARFQNPDGSFPSDFSLRGFRPLDARVKEHFHSYILNGGAAALNLLGPGTLPELERMVGLLADRMRASQLRSWGIPFGSLDDEPPGDGESAWRSSGADSAPGFALYAAFSRRAEHRETAEKLLLNAILAGLDMPEHPDFDGAIPRWCLGERGRAYPMLDGYTHFHCVMGLEALGL